jgi:hypothetical protein
MYMFTGIPPVKTSYTPQYTRGPDYTYNVKLERLDSIIITSQHSHIQYDKTNNDY